MLSEPENVKITAINAHDEDDESYILLWRSDNCPHTAPEYHDIDIPSRDVHSMQVLQGESESCSAKSFLQINMRNADMLKTHIGMSVIRTAKHRCLSVLS